MTATSLAAPLCLRRTGQRPLHFSGVELVSAQSDESISGVAIDVTVYETDDQQFVGALSFRFRDPYPSHISRARKFADANDVIRFLSAYKPADDLILDDLSDLLDDTICADTLSARAKDIDQRIQAVETGYQELLTRVFPPSNTP